ncbi:hypothetical protein DFP72DRAFT_763670, partial [Ephemerocybe angulata]
VGLRSIEGSIQHVDLNLLRNHSDLFDTMFTLPSPGDHRQVNSNHRTTVIDVFEKDKTLKSTLGLLTGASIHWSSIEEVYPILELVDKWDCHHLMRRIRDHLSTSRIPREQSLRFFALAKYLGWTEEARTTSKYTLSVDFQAPEHAAILAQIPTKDAQALIDLRRRRSSAFRKLLDSPTRFTGGNSSLYFCDTCCVAHPQDNLWLNFKKALSAELARMPCGAKIVAL